MSVEAELFHLVNTLGFYQMTYAEELSNPLRQIATQVLPCGLHLYTIKQHIEPCSLVSLRMSID